MKTLIEILDLSSDYLKQKGVSEPRLSAELLISFALKMKRIDIYLQYDRILNGLELSSIRELIRRRSMHEPVQYIIGEAEFYGLMFKVDRSVLIPRYDTETLVEKVSADIGKRKFDVLEIGTGSGCISVALANLCRNVSIVATDISPDALNIAAENAVKNKVSDRITFLNHDIFKNSFDRKFDVVISNPPYIMKEIIETLDPQVKNYEPVNALTDGGDGLAFYRRINDILKDILKTDGRVFLEIGYDQSESVTDIYKKSLENISVTRDISNNPRILSGKFRA